MTPISNARLFRTEGGADVVLSRTFRAPVEDVWASVTESDRTARWFGPWEGDAAPGRTIKIQMMFEDQAPWFDAHIDACEPPHRLAISTSDDSGAWHLELLLSEVSDASGASGASGTGGAGGVTELRLVQHLEKLDEIGEIGPGWEYYLDLLVASRAEQPPPRPAFADYYPALKEYFESL